MCIQIERERETVRERERERELEAGKGPGVGTEHWSGDGVEMEMPACIRGHTSSLSPPCQTLISSQNTFTDAPRNKVLSATGARLGPAKFAKN